MNAILDEAARMPSHTHLLEIFKAIGGRQREFMWLLTDIQIYGHQLGLPTLVDREAAYWISGKDLTQLVESHHMQFVWGVLSGFYPDAELNLEALDPHPFADCNAALWRPDVQVQHPLARVEIVCFDSSYTLFLSRENDLTEGFRAHFPEAIDLNEDNRQWWTKNPDYVSVPTTFVPPYKPHGLVHPQVIYLPVGPG